MNVLFQFLFKYRTLLLFIFLEGICFSIIVNNNTYHRAAFFTSSNQAAASMLSTSNYIKDYFSLREKNEQLALENAYLRQLILSGEEVHLDSIPMDSTSKGISAKVIDNSIFFRNNYITINKGISDGVRSKMGVVSSNGVVGQVKDVSQNYSTVISLLHSKSFISAIHKQSNTLCSVVWDGNDPLIGNIQFLPRHISLAIGDSLVTSGYNSIFPADYLIGVVEDLELTNDATFYKANLRLATDFYKLDNVYLLELPGQVEIDSLNSFIDHEKE